MSKLGSLESCQNSYCLVEKFVARLQDNLRSCQAHVVWWRTFVAWLQERYKNPKHPGLVDPLLALAAVELRQDDTASWLRYCSALLASGFGGCRCEGHNDTAS